MVLVVLVSLSGELVDIESVYTCCYYDIYIFLYIYQLKKGGSKEVSYIRRALVNYTKVEWPHQFIDSQKNIKCDRQH